MLLLSCVFQGQVGSMKALRYRAAYTPQLGSAIHRLGVHMHETS